MTKQDCFRSDSARQAGALCGSRFDDAGRLSFETQQDALDYASHLTESSRRRLAAENFHVADLYRQGRAVAVLVVAPRLHPDHFKLVASAVPNVRSSARGAFDVDACAVKKPAVRSKLDRKDALVLVRSSKSTDRPEFVVPSKVRFEPADEGGQRIGCPFKPTSDLSIQVLGVFPHRKVNVLDAPHPEGETGIAGGLIQGVSEMVDCSVCGQPQGTQAGTCESGADRLLAGLTIEMSDDGVRAVLNESLEGDFKILNAFLSAVED